MENSTSKIILHIGFHKTGSSALQYYLFSENNEGRPFHTVFPMCTWLNNADLAWACLGKRFPWQDRDYDYDSVIEHYKNATLKAQKQGKDVVISSEEFCRLNEHFDSKFFDRLGEALPLDQCKVLAYIRDPLQFLISRYCHEVLYGESRNFYDFVTGELNTADFRVRLKPWFDHFGSDRMCVKQYSSIDIVDNFNRQFGFATDAAPPEKISIGAGLDFALAEIYAATNRAIPEQGARKEILQALSGLALKKTSKEDMLLQAHKLLGESLLADLERISSQQLKLLSN